MGGSGGGSYYDWQFFDTVRIELPEAAPLFWLVVTPRGNLDGWSNGFYGGASMQRGVFPHGLSKLKLDDPAFRKRYDVGVSRGIDETPVYELLDSSFGNG